MMKRATACLLAIVLLVVQCAMAGVKGDEAVYVGGTANVKQGTHGALDASDENVFKFEAWQVPYGKIAALDYGQHVGRHWAYAALGMYGVLPILLTRKRHHYLTVEYSDDNGKTQAAIFEVGKVSIRSVLKTLEVRSGKPIHYEDKEAEKTGNK
jgi:hypothetical protein